MTDKENRIIQMLKEGKSYTDISCEMKVGPSAISLVKKKYAKSLNQASSTNDALLQRKSLENKVVGDLNSEKNLIVTTTLKPAERDNLTEIHPGPEAVLQDNHSDSLSDLPEEPDTDNILRVPFAEISHSNDQPLELKKNFHPSTEQKIINRFIGLDGKKLHRNIIYYFLMDIQSQINKKKIGKDSIFAEEIMHIQSELIKIWNKHKNSTLLFTFELDDLDRDILLLEE
jgi:hypothetical protein